jgi:hypothetical protein
MAQEDFTTENTENTEEETRRTEKGTKLALADSTTRIDQHKTQTSLLFLRGKIFFR